jgi:glutamate N-acetyltransferase/amino-acid N-acetyltransferase
MFTEINGGVTAPKGFKAAGIHCGIKRMNKDLSLIFSESKAKAAGVFTQNKVPAAPVLIDKKLLKESSGFRAIICNSGVANACTGERGYNDAWETVECTAKALKISADEVLVSSTGVIGQYLPMDKLKVGIVDVVSMLSLEGSAPAAQGIMTTDKMQKEGAVACLLEGVKVTLGGIAKGSGMIAPNMATMLAFITTDANVSQPVLQEALKRATDRSFNRISVDGDTSTNDMVLVLANGMSGMKEITSTSDPRFTVFYDAFESLLVKLCKMIVVDGEGATKFIEIEVKGAASEEAAVQGAKAVANSNLVKTAIHGADANWGRIITAIGYSGIEFDPEKCEISFGHVPILRKNYFIDFSEADAKEVLLQKEIKITVDLNQGNASASFWTCDLSKDYVAINANYRT